MNTQLATLRAEVDGIKDLLGTNQQKLQQQITQVAADVRQTQQQMTQVAADVQQTQGLIETKLSASQKQESPSTVPQPNASTPSFVGTQSISLDNTIKSRALLQQFEQAKGEADMVHTNAGLFGGRSKMVLIIHVLLCLTLSICIWLSFCDPKFPTNITRLSLLVLVMAALTMASLAVRLYMLLYHPRHVYLPTAVALMSFAMAFLAFDTMRYPAILYNANVLVGPHAAALPLWVQVGYMGVSLWVGVVTCVRMAVRVLFRDPSAKDFQSHCFASFAVYYLGNYLVSNPAYPGWSMLLGFCTVVCSILAYAMHRHVLSVDRKAEEVVREDKQIYDKRWTDILADPDNVVQLRQLQGVVDNMPAAIPADNHGDQNEEGEAKEGANKRMVRLRAETLRALRQHAGGRSKSQVGAGHPTKPRQLHGDMLYLYAQAHALNPHFQARMVQWAGRGSEEGTTVHHCGVKQRRRAIDKTWRCYAGDPSLLLDLVRGSITCRTVRGIIDCLARIQADPGVFVLNVKNRFDPQYNGHTTAGYRNLALLLVIVDTETARLGVHDHVCELQLGLAQINELKTAGGHRNYRKWRDMRAV